MSPAALRHFGSKQWVTARYHQYREGHGGRKAATAAAYLMIGETEMRNLRNYSEWRIPAAGYIFATTTLTGLLGFDAAIASHFERLVKQAADLDHSSGSAACEVVRS